MAESSEAPQRVSPLILPEAYRLPPRPGAESGAQAADAYRQTGFILGNDLRLLERGMNLQLAVLRDSYAVRYRTHAFAALAMPWSRAYACERDAIALALYGSYQPAASLLKAAAEALACQIQIRREPRAFVQWLARAGHPDEALKAVAVPLGQCSEVEALAQDPALGPVYRAIHALAGQGFGASLLGVAPESNRQKLAVLFADRAFHLGWAELTLGWALAVIARQLVIALEAADTVNITDEQRAVCTAFASEVATALGHRDRCAVEEAERDGQPAIIVTNFRRTPGAAPRRIVLEAL